MTRSSRNAIGQWARCGVFLSTAIAVVASASAAEAGWRNFRMATWDNPEAVDADIAMVMEGQVAPATGRYLLFLSSWDSPDFAATFPQMLASRGYDLSRVDAVIVDEPYWFANLAVLGRYDWSNPCVNPNDPRASAMARVDERLWAASSVVRALAPKVRFWINYSEPEVQWYMSGSCPYDFNGPHVDVISMDLYLRPFDLKLAAYYDFIISNRAFPGQQIALVPGLFFRDGIDDQQKVASYLQSYFDYANSKNRQCDLPLGEKGVTGAMDGCLVWMVGGWPGASYPDEGFTWRGERDPQSVIIRAAWRAQLANAIRDPLAGAFESLGTQQGLSKGIVAGWAVDRKTPHTPVYVDIWIDGKYAGGTRAIQSRSDIAVAYGISAAGFEFKIPDSYWNGAPHTLKVYAVAPTAEPGNNILLASTSFALSRTANPMLGYLEAVQLVLGETPTFTFRGWAIDRAIPGQPVHVDFWVDGQYWGGTRATGYRQDIQNIYGISNSGFSFPVPTWRNDLGCHTVKAYAVAVTAESWNHVELKYLVSTRFCFPWMSASSGAVRVGDLTFRETASP